MVLRDVASALRRRWYLTVVGLLATAGLCLVTMRLVPPTYEATASVVLLPPASSVAAGGNPYLQLGGLEQVADVTARALSSQDAVARVAGMAPDGTYEVIRDLTTSGPILLVTVEGKTSRATLATLKAVTDMVPPTLKSLQSSLSIATPSQIISSVLTSDKYPESVKKSTIRALIVAAGVGLVGTAAVVALTDSWLLRRRYRRSGKLVKDKAEGLAEVSNYSRQVGASDRSLSPASRREASLTSGSDQSPTKQSEIAATRSTRHQYRRAVPSHRQIDLDTNIQGLAKEPRLDAQSTSSKRRMRLNPPEDRPEADDRWTDSTKVARSDPSR